AINVPAGIYKLTLPPSGDDDEASGNLNLAAPLVTSAVIVITGAGAGAAIVDGNQIDNVLDVGVGRSAILTGVTLRNGKTAQSGGGINNRGTLTLSECVIESNQATSGGGIASTGSLKVIRSTVRSNSTSQSGGGLFLTERSTTTVRDSALH